MRTETMCYFKNSKKWSVPLEIMELYVGEMDADAFAEAAFGANAKMIQFTMNDVPAAQHILEILLGKRNAERADYIFENVDFSVVEGE